MSIRKGALIHGLAPGDLQREIIQRYETESRHPPPNTKHYYECERKGNSLYGYRKGLDVLANLLGDF
jgi:hypothetical protein